VKPAVRPKPVTAAQPAVAAPPKPKKTDSVDLGY
jgi:hypothetical protein